MKQFYGLLKREWLEHGPAFTWGPGVVLAVVLLAGVMTLLANIGGDVELSITEQRDLNEVAAPALEGEMGAMEVLAAMTLDVAGSTDAELEQKMAVLQMGVAQPFHLIFIVLATFALLASLYDERRDASVLFWKSMPVSDVKTVVSKLVFVLWLAPVVTIGAILLAQFSSLVLVSLYVEDGMGGRIWWASGYWWQPFKLVAAYLQFGLWMLPVAAWVMLVSAAVSRLPALWAVGVPWVLVLLEQILFGSELLARVITGQLRGWSVVSNAGGGHFDLINAHIWGGALVSAVFLAGAVVLRRRNNEI